MFNNAYDLLYVDWTNKIQSLRLKRLYKNVWINPWLIYLFEMIYWTLFPYNWAFKPKKEHRSDKRDPYNRRPIAIQIFFCIITILPQSLDSVHTSKSN